jgi:hypothetical protein
MTDERNNLPGDNGEKGIPQLLLPAEGQQQTGDTGDNGTNPGEQTGIIPEDSGEGPEKPELSFLELVYGVLFDPVSTFKMVAANPPLWQSILIYGIIVIFTGAMGIFINFRTLPPSLTDLPAVVVRAVQGILPLLAMGGVFFQFIKWFVYSALLHLLADFYGGKGNARGVFTVYGLAGLPTLFIILVQLLVLSTSPGNTFLNMLTLTVSLALSVWGIVLLIIGIREVHGFSTGRAVAVVFTPAAVIALLIVSVFIVLLSVVTSIPSAEQWRFL